MSQIIVENSGSTVLQTNYWESLYNKQGVIFLSVNSGAFRLFIPDGLIVDDNELTTAKQIVISVGPGFGRHCIFEIMFDDYSDSPYVLHFGTEQADRIPDAKDNKKEFKFIAYRNNLKEILDTTCIFRFASKIPCLKKWSSNT